MRVWLAGATGVIGWPLLEELVEAGHDVFAQTRSEEAVGRITAAGAVPFVCDAFDEPHMRDAVEAWRPDAVVHQLTSLPERINPKRVVSELAATNRLRREGTRILVEAAALAGAQQVVTQSIAFAYQPGSSIAAEDDPLYLEAPPSFRPVIEAVQAAEDATMAFPGLATVLRYGFFYGPRTIYAADGTFAADVRRRRIPIVGPGRARFPFIHVSDAVSATLSVLEAERPGVFNVVDDDPAPVAEWLPAYASALGAPPPRTVPRWLARLGAGAYGIYMMTELPPVSNARAKAELGWSPAIRSWRDGLLTEARASVGGVPARSELGSVG